MEGNYTNDVRKYIDFCSTNDEPFNYFKFHQSMGLPFFGKILIFATLILFTIIFYPICCTNSESKRLQKLQENTALRNYLKSEIKLQVKQEIQNNLKLKMNPENNSIFSNSQSSIPVIGENYNNIEDLVPE